MQVYSTHSRRLKTSQYAFRIIFTSIAVTFAKKLAHCWHTLQVRNKNERNVGWMEQQRCPAMASKSPDESSLYDLPSSYNYDRYIQN